MIAKKLGIGYNLPSSKAKSKAAMYVGLYNLVYYLCDQNRKLKRKARDGRKLGVRSNLPVPLLNFMFHLNPYNMVKISKAVADDAEVQKYIAEFVDKGPEKSARALAKSYSRDAKLNNFIKAATKGFSAGNSFFLDKARRLRVLDACNVVGITSLKEKQAAAIAVVQSDIDSEVTQKISDITAKGTMKLNGEQKAALEAASKVYRDFLANKLVPSVLDMLSHELCATEPEAVSKKEEAVVEK